MAHDVLAPVRLPARVRVQAPAWLAENGLVVAVVSAWVALLALWLPSLFVTDSWLALVDGRWVAAHGLPHHDALTAWTLGERWIDQQWGAHLVLYEVARLGGLRAAALLAVACVAAALALAALRSRRLGASGRSTALAVLVPLIGAPWMAQVRTQTLVLPLFVLVYARLASGRRLWLVWPALLVWANLHGSVSLAAGLCAASGALLLVRRDRRGLALLAAPAALLASPYGLDLVGYYRTMLVNPPLAHVVLEWKPMAVSGTTAPFFVTAFGFAALWGRHRDALRPFERWALPLLLVLALGAMRNATWFELALAVSLPRLLDAARPAVEPDEAVRRANVVLGAAAAAFALVVLGTHLAKPAAWFDRTGTPAQAAAAARAAGPHGVVLADDDHSDWLLWQRPELSGRVAYDVRFELFDARALARIVRLSHLDRPAWSAWARRHGLVPFRPAS